MRQYIDKTDVMAEIEKRLHKYEERYEELSHYEIWITAKKLELKIEELKSLRDFLNTFEVKEVDLDKELQQHLKDCLNVKFPTTDVELIKKDVEYTARKFFELGLKAQKKE